MKRILFVLIVLFSFITAHAQLRAPKTTVRDTVIVFKVSYDKYDVADEDAPCTFLEESATAFYIAGETYLKGEDSYHDSHTSVDGTEVVQDTYLSASVNGKASRISKTSLDKAIVVLTVDKYEFTGINIRVLREAVVKSNIIPEDVIPTYNKMLTLAALHGIKNIPEDAFTEEELAQVENLNLDPQQLINPQESMESANEEDANKSNAVTPVEVAQSARVKGRSTVGVPPRPSLSVQKEGTVVVDIWVNQNGSVIRAVPGAAGTTTTDKDLWNAARQAALKTKFNTDLEAKEQQQGTITYVFKLDGNDQETTSFQLVEKQPRFMGGGPNEFTKWVNKNLVYPKECKELGIQGRVTLQFTITKEGKVTNVKVIRSVDPRLDDEAVRVVSSSPRWTPGTTRGKAVNVTYTFPVIFQNR